MRAAAALLRGSDRARVLDIATGSADIPRALQRWGAANGVTLDIVAADVSPEILAEARRWVSNTGIRLVRADARTLPWPDGSFDLVCCCLALHHFPPAEARRVLHEMWRVSARFVLVTDLSRGYAAYLGTWLATHVLAANPLTRHDGPLSVLRAYTRSELQALAEAAGLERVTVRPAQPFRQVLIARKESDAARV